MAGFVENNTFGSTLLHGAADLVESHPATPHTDLDTKNKGWSIDHPLFFLKAQITLQPQLKPYGTPS